MATLSKRANPLQRKLLRIVEGAVKNAADAHPHWNLEPQMARSISKRAVGTLSSQLDEIGLAAVKPPLSANDGGGSNHPAIAQSSDDNMMTDAARPGKRQNATAKLIKRRSRRGPSKLSRRSPLSFLWKKLSIQVGALKKSGQTERYEAYIEVLKIISVLQKKAQRE